MTNTNHLETLTADTITDEQIAALLNTVPSDDPITADLCKIALSGEDSDGAGTTLGTPCTVGHARSEIARVINDARAMDDDSHPFDRRCGCDACYAANLQLLGGNG